MAAIPRHELMIHILDPSRSVEGNFVQYTVATTDGRVISGLLASESKTSVELIDAEGKRHAILREDIDQMAASKKSLMPEGFEKQVPPAGLNDLLAFLTQRGKYRPLDLSKAATIVSTRGMFEDARFASPSAWSSPTGPPRWSTASRSCWSTPRETKVPNVVLLYGPQGKFPPLMPRSVELACKSSAKAIHFLSGVSGWGYPLRPQGERFADRAAPLRRRQGRGPQAGKWRSLRGLYPGRRRPRLEARLHARQAADPLFPASSPSEKTRSSASSWSRARTGRHRWSWP